MDDFNRQMMEARRAAAREAQARLEAEAAAKAAQREEEDARADKPAPAGAGKLRLERRQGEWRYYLGEHRVRVGDTLELYVSREVGWMKATFQWGRRNTSPPSLRVVLHHPDDDTIFLGEAVISMPDDAVLRWPEPK
jgi:hypothetical protein